MWVRSQKEIDSLMKLQKIRLIADSYGIYMKPCRVGSLYIIPLFFWYDYSFGEPETELMNSWTDFYACKSPNGKSMKDVNDFFTSLNIEIQKNENDTIITFSHFLPSIGLLPAFIPIEKRFIYPVMGSTLLMDNIKKSKLFNSYLRAQSY